MNPSNFMNNPNTTHHPHPHHFSLKHRWASTRLPPDTDCHDRSPQIGFNFSIQVCTDKRTFALRIPTVTVTYSGQETEVGHPKEGTRQRVGCDPQ
jgi:rRNA maturation protein Nop10